MRAPELATAQSQIVQRGSRAAVDGVIGRGLIPVLLALLVLVAPAAWGAAGGLVMSADAVPGRLLVGLKQQMQPTQAQRLNTLTGGRLSKRLAGGQVIVIDLPAGADMQATASRLLMDPVVAFVEPDRMMYPALVPNDPQYAKQYHHEIIRSPAAWDVTTGSREIVIAVVDTGVDLDHPDLAANIWTNPGEVPGNGRDDDGNGFVDDVNGWDFENDTNNPNPAPNGDDDDANGEPDDQVNHGTLVAGLAAAVGNNNWGTAGVTWRTRIMPVQVFPDDGGASVSQVIEGIDYAIDMGADVINLSVGGTYSDSFTPVITRAYNAGIVVVAAAGNGGRQITDSRSTWESPACNDGDANRVIGVAATDRNDLRASFSNYDGSTSRTFVDCCAPGEGMYGPGYYDPAFADFSSYFDTNSGTSFAVPLVSGLAALVLSRNPGMSPAQVMAAVRDGCDSIDAINPGFAGKLGAGRINCARTLGVPLAPRPPRDPAAYDTPDDTGGSITVVWQLSLDDGAGAKSVTEYAILRRLGLSGSFAEVGRVGAGTAQFVDDGVEDGVDYYYRIRATDGTLFSDSSTVGPVQSRNDGAPPPVQGVYAEDRPADSGGAIVVGWSRYQAPDDFDHFAIYRARARFSSVASMQPLAEVSDPTATQYVDDTVQDGVDYFYAVTAVDEFGNQNVSVTACGPVQSLANGPMTLPAGLRIFGSPLEPADGDPAAFLGLAPAALKMARWSPADERYQMYSGPGSLPLVLGQGYWLKLDQPLSFVPSGSPVPAGSLTVSLQPGWHQLSNPYFAAMDLAAMTVEHNGATMDLASADAADVMRQVFWTYNAADNGYTLIAPLLGIGESTIPAWEGFWARVEKACTVTMPRPGLTGAGAGLMSAAVVGAGEWVARLSARGRGGQDRDNFFGVSERLAQAGPLVSPPPTAGGVELYFEPGDGSAERLAARFSPAASVNARWQMRVQGQPGEEIELWCPEPGAIPRGYVATVSDPASGVEVDLRHGRLQTTLRADETSRTMVLRLTRTGGALTLGSLTAQPTRAGGGQLDFILSAAARCTVKVLNIAGRTVRVVEQDRQRSAGPAQVVWDGRSDSGLSVPSGMYLLQVEAVAEDGSRVQAMRTLTIGH